MIMHTTITTKASIELSDEEFDIVLAAAHEHDIDLSFIDSFTFEQHLNQLEPLQSINCFGIDFFSISRS